ncbi:NAD(P)H-dependent glycerol-3-phosphate dehydrogenase [Rhodobium gokarnense]|uniref:Glycerol-3-phosphate dehydrogenase [NAD(P)+] n=1 Tax=Rhodobium gokarnense TaxID=364296 RepID=A0ABT3HHN4_9HYPH|nr:NAD(P)H-dependent glycerol-3-phosphate dehydrogenase [Rhodobium gokarnense]MCW2309854.1 glycerol-3-phosphate dehydrogenase (NAD(P)+) [Rhodobium gokarnense]
METFDTIGIIGAGAWGSALALVASRAGRKAILWGRDAETVASVNAGNGNPRYLPGIPFKEPISGTIDLSEAASADLLLLVTPAQTLRAVLRDLQPLVASGTPVVLCAKGIERSTGRLMSEVLVEELPQARPAALSGPSFASDVARGLPTAVTIASADGALADAIADSLSAPAFRPYAATDLVGVEIGGALKNVLAIGAGAVAGARLGKSAEAALIARGFAEIRRFARRRGAEAETLMGLSGLGDLMLTCSSVQSRNYAFGIGIGEGAAVADLLARGRPLAEGAMTALIARDLARREAIDMPITEVVAEIVEGRLRLDAAIERLMRRPLKREEA